MAPLSTGGELANDVVEHWRLRVRDGFLHSSAIQHADESIDELDPPPPPHHGPKYGLRGLGFARPDAPGEAN